MINPEFSTSYTVARNYNDYVCAYLSNITGKEFVNTEWIHTEFYSMADKIHGCDGFIFEDNSPTVGVALRTQGNPYQNERTFTIRYKRKNEKETEFSKRLKQIESGELYPKLTVQAYVSKLTEDASKALFTANNVHYLRIAVCKTKALYQYVEDNWDKCYTQYKIPVKDGNYMFAIPFSELPEDTYQLYEK